MYAGFNRSSYVAQYHSVTGPDASSNPQTNQVRKHPHLPPVNTSSIAQKRPPLYPRNNSLNLPQVIASSLPSNPPVRNQEVTRITTLGVGTRTSWKIFAEEIAAFVASFSVDSGSGSYTINRTSGSFSGEIVNGSPLKGKIDLVFGSYDGKFVNGKPDGQGIMTVRLSKKSYKGEFKEGLFDGQGIELTSKGFVIYGGSYEKGLRHGDGILVMQDKTVLKVKYERGIVISQSKILPI
jgi:hypothetical protein